MASVFANAIQFLNELGLYDVVLPFLLSFTIVFAILDKTRVLGEDDIDGHKYSKKNLNALVAFCVAFFVIASSTLVATINKAIGQIVILLLIVVFYMVLIGVFHENGKSLFLEGKWRLGFMIALLIGIILIFMNSIPVNKDGMSVLEWVYRFVLGNIDTGVVSAVIFLVFIIIIIMYATSTPKEGGKK